MNPIPTENQRPGTKAWINTNARVDNRRRSPDIEGYCSKLSYRTGEKVEISVSSTAPFVVEFYRLGFYGGDGARLMRTTDVIQGTQHGDPPIGDRQLRECAWPPSVDISIPSDWVSGVYLGKMTQVNVASPAGSYVIFVVRDDRSCDFLFKCSETTWSAYNAWPDKFSLYDFHGTPAKIGYWGPGVRVSFDRPYALAQPWYMLHEPERLAWMIGASQFLTFEYPLLFWMESRGFDVSYMSCMDLHDSSPVTLRQRARALLSTGHDEYVLRCHVQQLEERRRGVGRHPAKGPERGVFLRREPDRRARSSHQRRSTAAARTASSVASDAGDRSSPG